MIGDWDWNLLYQRWWWKPWAIISDFPLNFHSGERFFGSLTIITVSEIIQFLLSAEIQVLGLVFLKCLKYKGKKWGPILVVRLHPWSHSVLDNVAGELLTDTLSSHFCRTYYPLDILSEPHIAKRSFIGLPFYSGLCYELKMQWY